MLMLFKRVSSYDKLRIVIYKEARI